MSQQDTTNVTPSTPQAIVSPVEESEPPAKRQKKEQKEKKPYVMTEARKAAFIKAQEARKLNIEKRKAEKAAKLEIPVMQ
jgi:hypothetical protein